MKKTYSNPTTEIFRLFTNTAMLAGSTVIEKTGSGIRQDLSGAGVLGSSDDDGSSDLAKGGGLWD